MQFLLNGLPIGAIYALVALSYSLIYTSSGVLNWSQGDMVMLGAYIGFMLHGLLNFGYGASFIPSMFIVAMIGVAVQYFVLKPLQTRQIGRAHV